MPKIPRTDRNIIEDRLDDLYMLLAEPHTLEQLALKLGRSKKMVYKDIGKLAYRGYKLGSKLGIYWLEE